MPGTPVEERRLIAHAHVAWETNSSSIWSCPRVFCAGFSLRGLHLSRQMWQQRHRGYLPSRAGVGFTVSAAPANTRKPGPGCCLLLLDWKHKRIELLCPPLPESPPGLTKKRSQSFCTLLSLCDTGSCPCPLALG